MKCLLSKVLLISAICLYSVYSYAADFGYQGTHILTHGALEDLARAFEKKYGSGLSHLKGGDCSDGIAVVINNRLQMGGMCCPLSGSMAQKYGMASHKVADDIKAVIVNRKNTLSNLSLKQISDIHNGLVKNWKEAGWQDRPVALIFREHCRDKDEPVRSVLGIKSIAKKAIVVKTDKEVIEYVEKFPAAIGVVSKVFAEKASVKIINIDGISPTPENTEKGLYALKGGLYIITKKQPEPLTEKFIDFVLSDEGQSIIRKHFAGVK